MSFAVAPERLDAVAEMFTELGFTLAARRATERWAAHSPRLEARDRAHQPDRGIDRFGCRLGQRSFLNTKGDGVYTVVLQVPDASAAESVAERYGVSTRFQFEFEAKVPMSNEIELSVFGLPLTFMSTQHSVTDDD